MPCLCVRVCLENLFFSILTPYKNRAQDRQWQKERTELWICGCGAVPFVDKIIHMPLSIHVLMFAKAIQKGNEWELGNILATFVSA